MTYITRILDSCLAESADTNRLSVECEQSTLLFMDLPEETLIDNAAIHSLSRLDKVCLRRQKVIYDTL